MLADVGNAWDGRRIVLGVSDAGDTLSDLGRVLLTHPPRLRPC